MRRKRQTKIRFNISSKPIVEGGRIFIIAEAGVNHNGKLDLALKLIDKAYEVGADAVKFQTFKAEQVVTEKGEMAFYQKKNIGEIKSQEEMLRELELKEEYYPLLIKRAKQKGILFLSTPHGGRKSVRFLETLKMEAYKIGSGDLTNFILLDEVAKTGKPIILSTGMATMKEINDAISFIRRKGNERIAALHCTTDYPCSPEDVNLSAMISMMKGLDVPVGFSDHTQNHTVVLMASTLGMAIYEFHITLDKSLSGPDHAASASPEEAKTRIEAIRMVHTLLGNSVKEPTMKEKEEMIPLIRKSIVAIRDLPKGYVLTEYDLEAKRPGDGISPNKYEMYLGKRLKKAITTDQQLSDDFIE